MNLIFIAFLLGLIVIETLQSAYFGSFKRRPKWVRWFDGGIIVLLVVFVVIVAERALSLLKL